MVKGLLSCIEFNRDLPLELQPPGKGLPEDTSLNHYSPTIPVSIPSNLSHSNSLLHHTPAEGIPHTPSDNILVTDHFFHNTVIRDLSYVPTNSSAHFTYQINFPRILSISTIPNPINNLLPNNFLVNVITVPPKNWRPKVKHNCKPINYKDVDDDLCVLNYFGKVMKYSPT